MSLTLITGPANSGKTGAVLERFTAALEREPVLVLPTRADVERFEEELLARRPVAVGGRLLTFQGLFEAAAASAGAVTPPVVTAAQRQALVAAVVREAPLHALRAPALRRGFPAALDAFLAEAQAAGVDPAALAGRVRAPHLRELAALYAAYRDRLRSLGRTDAHGLAAAAVAALEARPEAWGGRPVFLHGFDDLTREQLALVGALAAAAEVSVAVVHEEERACLAARGRLLAQLQTIGGVREQPLPPHAGTTLLAHLERGFLVDGAPAREPDGSLVLLEAAGVRNEVEQAGAEVAALLRAGAAPDTVAVIVRTPEAHAGLIEQVFGSYGIPLAVDARVPLPHTSVGRGLLALVRAALTSRSAADLVAYLRCPGRAGGQAGVDRLERAVRVDRLAGAAEAAEAWHAGGGRELWELEALRRAAERGPGALLGELAGLAHDLFEYPLRRTAPVLEPAARLDQAAAEQAAGALRELGELVQHDRSLAPDAAGVVELLESLEVRRSAGATGGRVQVISPYRARARRFAHVVVLSLQEGEFPRRGREDPFLTEEERLAAGLPERADPRDEERYLFYVCLSRPTRTLFLSYRTADEDGAEVTRSFFVDDVLDLVAPGPIVRAKHLSDTVFPPARAPSEHELARSLAAWGLSGAPSALGLATQPAERLARRLTRARERATALPGPLRVPVVREAFAARDTFGASSLELYAECPFRYFVGHELHPRELQPEADARARGALIHAVLERLYEERGSPTPDTLAGCVARGRELLAEVARGTALAPEAPATRAVYRRMESDLVRFVEWDAAHPVGLDVLEVEAGFGREDDEHGPLTLTDGVRLHGKIDRIDAGPGGIAFIRDYKSGSNVASAERIREEKRFQLPLYMLAVRELWRLDPVGAVYHPLGKQYDQLPRGLVRAPVEPPLDPSMFRGPDIAADFEERLDAARADAVEEARRIQAGHLGREPLGGKCPRHCEFHAICRRDRGDKNPEENGNGRPPGDE